MLQECPARTHEVREWPLRTTLPLGPILTAAGCARAHATNVLWEWGMPGLAETVALVVSELVANAVAESQAMDDSPFPVRFWLLSDRKQVFVLVWDGSPRPPVRLDPADDVESGRGLMIVEALADTWNWYRSVWDGIEGKAVWALITAK